jgi:DNA modification methylase
VKPYYQDDFATIYHGDCREVLPTLEHGADLLVTDPPYGINYVSARSGHGQIAGDTSENDGLEGVRQALRCLRFNRHFYVFGPFDLSPLTFGATVELIWDEGKHGGGNISLPWASSHERITFGVWTPYPSQKNAGATAARLRKGSVLRYATPNNGRGAKAHPTRKPVDMLRVFVESSSHFGEVVLDPFMGSGSTLEAATLEGRRSIGIELEERYCEIAAKRLAQEVLDFGGAA